MGSEKSVRSISQPTEGLRLAEPYLKQRAVSFTMLSDFSDGDPADLCPVTGSNASIRCLNQIQRKWYSVQGCPLHRQRLLEALGFLEKDGSSEALYGEKKKCVTIAGHTITIQKYQTLDTRRSGRSKNMKLGILIHERWLYRTERTPEIAA